MLEESAVTNNDVLRSVQKTLDLDAAGVAAIFAEAGHVVNAEDVEAWLKKDDETALSDVLLATFLNGLINDQRGKKDGPQPVPEETINNNIIFRKLKIALDLQADDILEILASAGVTLSKHELSAFFRKPEHKHYRACRDDVLQAFLQGVQQHF